MASSATHLRLAIIGSGPAAFTAGLYASRAELAPVIFEGKLPEMTPGGQLTTTTDVENFPGFPSGIGGIELVDNMKAQAVRFGSKIISELITDVNLNTRPFVLNASNGLTYTADCVIIATGATARLLDFPGAKKYFNNGISACAVCDGALPMFRKKPMIVIGGGDSACEEATFLTKFASKVYLVVRSNQLRASKVMQQRVLNHEKIEIMWQSQVSHVDGDNEGMLNRAFIVSTHPEKVNLPPVELPVNGLFFAVGHVPGTQFLQGQLKCDSEGYIITNPGTTETSIDGVFACGDVQDRRWRQAITAAGTGCMAALQAEHYLTSHEKGKM